MTIEKLKEIINMSNTYIGEAPIEVDNCQWIRPTSGAVSIHFGKTAYNKCYYTIFVRDKKNETAYKKIYEIYHKVQYYVEECSEAVICERLPSFAGRDEKYRSVYSLHVEYQIGGN